MAQGAEKIINRRSDMYLVDGESGESLSQINAGDRVRITRKPSADSFAKLQK